MTAAGCVSAAVVVWGMYMRACVFVDGENFRHSIVKLFPQFRQEDYLPKLASWANLFDWIVENVIENGERVRTYWYVIKSIDFFPYHFPDPTMSPRTKEQLQHLLSMHKPYQEELATLDEPNRISRMMEIVKDLRQRQDNLIRRFNGWITIQEGISLRHKAIEFRRAGAMTCNLFENSLGREKAVDVKLASDMITLKDIYDIAVIVSGDQDYVPAVEVVKDYGKRVVNVAFETRGGELLPGGARRLNQVTDWGFNIPYQSLAEHLHISQLPLT
jgi:uncharacterized LabA/DUF88 family protein